MYDIIFIGNNEQAFSRLRERFPTSKKVTIKTDILDAFNEARRKAFTKMFWVVWDDLVISPDFKFDYNVEPWDEQYIHLFLNDTSYDGICLFSKVNNVSKKELSCRFFINKKETNICASYPVTYDKFEINSYDEYLNAAKTASTDMFWVITNSINVNPNFKFDLYFSHHDQYNRRMNHVFKNGKYYDGIFLASKNKIVSRREFDYKFFVDKKEWDILASTPKPLDIVFISYFESCADKNYQRLKDKIGNRQLYRIDGIKGIHNAHRHAAEIVKSDMFWVVDADAILLPEFNFEFPQVISHDTYTKSIVHVWRSRNPINDLEYGYGGVKLLPKKLTMNMDMSNPDMTTSISASFKAMPEVSNVAGFNTDPFTTWRSAFRECVKLASKTIRGQVDTETENRLDIWCTVGKDRPFGEYAISGAKAGRDYGQKNAGNIPALSLINDYDWLKNRYQQTH